LLQMVPTPSIPLVLLPLVPPDTSYHQPMFVPLVLLPPPLLVTLLVPLLDSTLLDQLVLLVLLQLQPVVTQPVPIKDSPPFLPLLTE